MTDPTVHRVAGGVGEQAAVQFLLRRDRAETAAFYPHPVSVEGMVAVARARGSAEAPAGRLAQGTWAVVTGQQACLLGGPLMIAWKALTAIAVARVAEAQLGEPVTPVFWAATEDHDLDEIRVVRTLDAEGRLRRRSIRFAGEHADTPAQDALLGSEIQPLLDEVVAELHAGEHAAEITDDLRSTYSPNATAGSAFVGLMRRWFDRFGLRVIEPRDVAGLWREPIDLEARDAFAGALVREAGERLRSRGVQPPLEPSPGAQVYGIANGHRMRGPPAPGAQPSAAASLRPAWQDGALATLAYVGGAAEVAYYGQLRGVHERIGATFPVVWPRASGTLLEPSHMRILDALGIPVERLLEIDPGEPPERAGLVPEGARTALERLGRSIDTELASLGDELGELAELQQPIRRTAGSLHANLDRLAGRVSKHFETVAGVDRDRRERLTSAVRPEGVHQERKLSSLSFLARHGHGLFDRMLAAIDPGDFRHIVLPL